MNNNEENKAVELTDEDLKQVSGGWNDAKSGQTCPNYDDCEGYYVSQCPYTYCCKGYK